jgi:hypothetical protein
MAVLAQLRKYELVVQDNLKLAPIHRNERDGFNLWLKFFQQLGR